MLKEIPRGTTFVMRLVEPLKAGFGESFATICNGYRCPLMSNVGGSSSSGHFRHLGSIFQGVK